MLMKKNSPRFKRVKNSRCMSDTHKPLYAKKALCAGFPLVRSDLENISIRAMEKFFLSNGNFFDFPEKKKNSIDIAERFSRSDCTNREISSRAFQRYMGLYVGHVSGLFWDEDRTGKHCDPIK